MSFRESGGGENSKVLRRYQSLDDQEMLNSSKRHEVKFSEKMSSSDEFEISVVIPRRARAHRLFLSTVEDTPQLHAPHVILNAIRRYEKYWLPLVAEYEGGKDLEPPIDVHWIWHAHMLGPKYYHGDCIMLCGRVPDHKLHTAATVNQARFEAKRVWDSKYRDEPFDVDYSTVKADLQYRPKTSYNLREAASRQKSFFYNVSLPHYLDERFTKTAVGRYKQFIRLKKIYPREYIVPMYDVDLIWHTHMLSPLSYKKDTEAYLGRLLHHDDTSVDRSSGSRLATADTRTKELWHETYHTHFSSPGCMYRGVSPQEKLHPFNIQEYDKAMAKKCGFRISKIVVKCDKKKDAHFDAHFDVISNGEMYLTQDQSLGKCRQSEHGTYVWDPDIPTPKGLYQFDMDSLSTYMLRLEITKRGALKGLLPGKDHVEFRIELSDAIHKIAEKNSSDNGQLAKIILDTRQEPCCHLYVHCALSQLKRMDEDFKLIQDGFETVTMPEHIEQLWGPIPLPTLPSGVSNTCRVASHKLVSEQGYRSFTCRVIHSLPLRMSVVQVFQGPRMVAVSHLIGIEQLPTDVSDRVGNPNASVILETKLGERALLIKNTQGDWGIVKGYWAGFRKEKLGRGSRRAKPGYLKIRYYNLRGDKVHAQSATLFDRSGTDTSFKLGGVEVDVKQGTIKIRGDTDDVAENLALAFSVLMLFMLCEPRDRVTVQSLRKGYGPGKPFTDQTASHDYLYQTNPRRIMFFLIIGYNEETPSNSHLYLASKEEANEVSSGTAVAADGQLEQEFLASDNIAVDEAGDEIFCPWEHGDASGGDLGSSSYDASFSASATYNTSYNGVTEASCGASCGSSCGASCGASCGGSD